MQRMMTSIVGSGTIRTLADIGLKTNFQDGTLTIDSGRLGTALAANPQAINQIFSIRPPASARRRSRCRTATPTSSTVCSPTASKSLNTRIKQMDTQADQHAGAASTRSRPT